MRIGMITGEYPPMQGGVGDFTLKLARELAKMGHELFVLTSNYANPPQSEHGITVQASVEQWGRLSRGSSENEPGDKQALEWVRQNQLDIVNIQYQAAAYNMNVAANQLPNRLRKHVQVVTTFHDLLVPYLFPKAGGLRKKVIYQMAQRSQGVIVTNRQDEHELQQQKRMPRISRIPIGSNIAVNPPSNYSPEDWRHHRHIPADAYLVGYFGFVNKTKGVDTLAHAVRLLIEQYHVPTHLLVIGGQTGASDQTNIQQADIAQQLIGGLGITRHVSWTGFVEAQEVSAHLMACDVVALPFKDGVSLRRGTLMAALLHGCPIVTTFPDEEDPDLVDGQTMRMIPPDDPKRLAEVLYELKQNADQRLQLGQAARGLAQAFEWDTIARQTSEFYYSCFS